MLNSVIEVIKLNRFQYIYLYLNMYLLRVILKRLFATLYRVVLSLH